MGRMSTARGAPDAASRRDTRLDVLRGLCLISMICGHLAAHRWPDRFTHPIGVVDGAAGFVLLSGVVLGRIQRRRPDLLWPLRRARRIWAIHCGLLLAAFAIRAASGRPGFLPHPREIGSLPELVAGVALLRVQPDWFTVLPFYVIALLATPVIVLALTRGRTRYVVAVTVPLYLLSQQVDLNPSDVFHGVGMWDWGGWQLLYVMGFLAGWHWETLVTWSRDRIFRRSTLALGVLAAVMATSLGRMLPREDLLALFDKFQVPPGVPVVVLLLGAPAYWLAGRIPPVLHRFLAQLGSHSLRGYVLLSVVQFLTFTFWLDRSLTVALVSISLVVLLTWVNLPRPRSRPSRTTDAVALSALAARSARRPEERSAA